MRIPETVIEQAVAAIINSRDFCGNEREAAYEVAHENGLSEINMMDKVYRIANFRANARWNAFKKAAGVNPKNTW